MAPTAGLRWAGLFVFVGLVTFMLGFGLSFFHRVVPQIQKVALAWDDGIAQFVGRDKVDQANHLLGGALLLLGVILIVKGVRDGVRRVVEILNPSMKDGKVVNVLVRRQQLAAGPRIVALGGGTGLSTLLRGLKQHSSNITAVVTVTDDGGSSGRLSKELGIIPPGDIRNCLVALADAEKLMTDVFQHRFKNARGSLAGHSLGNLLIAGLVDQCGGDFDKALSMASEVLNIRGRVTPSTLDQVRLRAVLEDGTEVCGETAIVESGRRIRRIFLDPGEVKAFPDSLAAIREADLIVVGPGSVFTSVIPNLLVPGISEALAEAEAPKVYVCNVMTQPGESDQFTASEHVSAIIANVDRKVFDYVVVNTGTPSSVTLEKYRSSDQYFVDPDIERIRAMGLRAIVGNFMNESDYVRHDPLKVAQRLVDLLQ